MNSHTVASPRSVPVPVWVDSFGWELLMGGTGSVRSSVMSAETSGGAESDSPGHLAHSGSWAGRAACGRRRSGRGGCPDVLRSVSCAPPRSEQCEQLALAALSCDPV